MGARVAEAHRREPDGNSALARHERNDVRVVDQRRNALGLVTPAEAGLDQVAGELGQRVRVAVVRQSELDVERGHQNAPQCR